MLAVNQSVDGVFLKNFEVLIHLLRLFLIKAFVWLLSDKVLAVLGRGEKCHEKAFHGVLKVNLLGFLAVLVHHIPHYGEVKVGLFVGVHVLPYIVHLVGCLSYVVVFFVVPVGKDHGQHT